MRRFLAIAGLVLATFTSTMADQLLPWEQALDDAIADLDGSSGGFLSLSAVQVKPNKTVRGPKPKLNDVNNKNYNCLYCKKQAKLVAACYAKTSNYNSTTSTECKQLAADLLKWCNGLPTFTMIPTATGGDYVVVDSLFPCREGPIVAYAKKADTVYAKNVKYLTCKTCNAAIKAWEKCVVGKTLTGATQTDVINNYKTIAGACAAEVGTLVQHPSLCVPVIFDNFPRLLPDVDASGKVVGIYATSTLSGVQCAPIVGTFLKNVYNNLPVTYIGKYAGVGTTRNVYFN